MSVQSVPRKGETAGYRGKCATVLDVIEHGRRVRILYNEDRPRRDCHTCQGNGWVDLGIFRSKVRTQSCDTCRGTGTLAADRVTRDRWVDGDAIHDAPAPDVDDELVSAGAALLRDPMAALRGDS